MLIFTQQVTSNTVVNLNMNNDSKKNSAASLVALVYKSTAIRVFTDAEIKELLNKARIRNKENNVSGILVYCDGFFLQYLEGPESNLAAIYNSIKKDNRHNNIRELSYKNIEKREFSNWCMAYSTKLEAFAEKFT